MNSKSTLGGLKSSCLNLRLPPGKLGKLYVVPSREEAKTVGELSFLVKIKKKLRWNEGEELKELKYPKTRPKTETKQKKHETSIYRYHYIENRRTTFYPVRSSYRLRCCFLSIELQFKDRW